MKNYLDKSPTAESRLTDPEEVQNMVMNMARADEARSTVRAKVKGLVDGNPPYSKSELKKNAQSYRCNVNFREAESFLSMGLSAFYDVFSEVPQYATVDIEHDNPNTDESYSKIITEEFDRMQKKDTNFDYLMQLSQHEMVLYGYGPMVFEDTLDWRCKPIRCGDLLIPEKTKSNVNEWVIAAVRSVYQVHELYGFIKNEEAATAAGWNISAVRQAIMDSVPEEEGSHSKRRWEYYQQAIRNNDLSYSSECDVIRATHVYYREFPDADNPQGAITHCMIDERGDGSQFLFRNLKQFKGWEECIHCLYYDKGDGQHHSVKGMGVKMFSALELKNRLKCSLIDAAVARTAIHFQPQNPSDLNRTSIVQMGPYTVIPPGMQIQQTNSAGVLDAPLKVEEALEGTLQAGLSQYRQRLEKDGNPRTATEIEALVAQQSILGKTQLNRYYNQLDALFTERYRRAINPDLTEDIPGGADALEFQKRCKDRGVPKAALKAYDSVKATRTNGRGSALERRNTMNQLLGLSQMLPETGRQHVIEDTIASMTGFNSLERYFPVPQKDPLHQEHVQEAAYENALFKLNEDIPVSDSDNHAIHAQSHLSAGSNSFNSLEQGGNPEQVTAYLQFLLNHTAMHIQALAKDGSRKELHKQVNQQFQQLINAFKNLGQQLQAKNESQQAAQTEGQGIQAGTDAKDQVLQMRAQRDMDRKDASTAADIQRKQMEAQADIEMQRSKEYAKQSDVRP
jgi:hypothetical protein